VIEPASAQPVLGTVSPGRRDLAGGEEMTSLAAATRPTVVQTSSGEDEAARLVHEAETALHDAREPGVDAWIEKRFGK
jgi:hypothetical protein